MSAMVLYPALYASLSLSHSSGNCTKINFLLPLSSLLSSKIAWAAVPLPAKKSKRMSVPSAIDLINFLIKSVGLG